MVERILIRSEKKEIRLIQTNNSWWNSSTKNYTDYLKKSLKVDS